MERPKGGTNISHSKEEKLTLVLRNLLNKKKIQLLYDGEDITFTITATYTSSKVLVWDSLTNLNPVCDVEVVKQSISTGMKKYL